VLVCIEVCGFGTLGCTFELDFISLTMFEESGMEVHIYKTVFLLIK
jgi:hypothetical protein